MGKIKWTEKSSVHLQAIHEYIARNSKTYATRFIKSLIKATEKVENVPLCGRVVPELEGYGFREVILRHSFNTRMRKAGVAESVIMKITGHSTREMFDR